MSGSVTSLLLAAALAAEPVGAPGPSTPPALEYTLKADRSFLIPAVENFALNFIVNAFGQHVLQAEYARVTGETFARNLAGGWRIDTDDLWINYVGHPYQGSLAFNAARSSGLSFWESLPATLLSSAVWEIAGEAEPPSINDLVITSTSGAVVGEALHRISSLLWDGRRPSSFRDLLIGAMLDPLGGFNRTVFGRRRDRAELPAPPPYELAISLGLQHARAGALREPLTQAIGSVDLLYGASARASPDLGAPMSLFRFRAELGGHGPIHGVLRVDGLLAGRPIRGEHLTGAWGLFSVHDFQNGTGFRSAGSALGPGAWLSMPLGAGELRAYAVASWVLLGAAGTLSATDDVHRAADLGPAYAVGTGFSTTAEVSLRASLGEVRVFADTLQLFPSTAHGFTATHRVGSGGHVELGSGHGLGAELRADRLRTLGEAARPWGYGGRVFWVYQFGQG